MRSLHTTQHPRPAQCPHSSLRATWRGHVAHRLAMRAQRHSEEAGRRRASWKARPTRSRPRADQAAPHRPLGPSWLARRRPQRGLGPHTTCSQLTRSTWRLSLKRLQRSGSEPNCQLRVLQPPQLAARTRLTPPRWLEAAGSETLRPGAERQAEPLGGWRWPRQWKRLWTSCCSTR